MTIISLGAGVQSSTMALMAATGELEMPDCAIFADTGWEPRAVYEWLDWLEEQLPYPVYRVQRGNLRQDLFTGRKTKKPTAKHKIIYPGIPFFNEGGGLGKRQCTEDYKLKPLRAKVRDLGHDRKAPADVWVGISLDEVHRVKPSRVQYIVNSWPLIDRRITRKACVDWLTLHGHPTPPRSACLGCPYHSDAYWRSLRDSGNGEWEDTVMMDNQIRELGGFGVDRPFKNRQFMHRSLVPLDDVDFSTDEDRGQLVLDGFGNECEGMCGV